MHYIYPCTSARWEWRGGGGGGAGRQLGAQERDQVRHPCSSTNVDGLVRNHYTLGGNQLIKTKNLNSGAVSTIHCVSPSFARYIRPSARLLGFNSRIKLANFIKKIEWFKSFRHREYLVSRRHFAEVREGESVGDLEKLVYRRRRTQTHPR